MKNFKRIVCLILVVGLLTSIVPLIAKAEESTHATVDNSSVSVEGTNSFGTLLADDIAESESERPEDEYPGGYSVIGLTIESGTATVEYDTLEEAILVVALYTEDGLQMLISGHTTVQPEETMATVALDGEIPTYFMASAYLIDTYDYTPLCSAYDTPMYTQEMQELLESTVDDYDANKVLNLDDNNTTNFAVYADTTKVIDYVEGENVVVSADDETATYVIENANESITGLQAGDVFVYAYGDNEILIVKVAELVVNGTAATITGADLEMEEVFTHVKIESDSSTTDFAVDESTASDGVTFDGIDGGASTYSMRSGDTEIGTSQSLSFTLDEKIKTGDAFEGSITVKGSIKLSIDVSFSYYVSSSRQFIEFKTEMTTKASVSISGKIEVTIPLPSLCYSPVPGASIGFKPAFKVEVSGKIEVSASLKSTVGVSYENGKGFQSLNTKPTVETDVTVEGTVFIGIDLSPCANILGGKLVKIGFESPVGVELTAKLTGTSIENIDRDAESVHTCEKCLEMELVFKLELTAELKLFNLIKYENKLLTKEYKIGDMYYSFDYDEFGWKICPHKTYRVTVYVQDADENPFSGVTVNATWNNGNDGYYFGTTNSHGLVAGYFTEGEYTIQAVFGEDTWEKTVNVEEACKVVFGADNTMPGTGITGSVNQELITDYGEIVASGECGADGDNVTWVLYSSGLLNIDGYGWMNELSSSSKVPWYSYRNSISTVRIANGISNIGAYAFCDCSSLMSVSIPDSVVSIGDEALGGCTSLTSITIPDGVTSLGAYAFCGCTSLTSITIPDGVTIIREFAFDWCTSLTTVTLSNSVTEIWVYAFAYCSSLTSLTIPDSVTVIAGTAFAGCTNLTSITIPGNVTEMEGQAFMDCNHLKKVIFCGDAPSIGNYAFGRCSMLTEIMFYGDAPIIYDAAFYGVAATAYYPANNPTWTTDVMQNYGGTITWVPYKVDGADENSAVTFSAVSAAESEEATGSVVATQSSQLVTTLSVWGGEYETEVLDSYTLKSASFSNLMPGKDYLLLALVSIEVENILAADNLLYIDQGTAAEDGTLVFQYVQRVDTDISYVMACGASDKDLNNATITFPELVAGDDIQAVNPTVVYEGKTLVEGKDYVIVGKVDFAEAGEYTCYIRGIYDYTGLVECTYTVAPARLTLAGANMVLGSTLDMNFFINKTDLSGTDYYAEITHYAEDGTTTHTVPYDQWDERTNYMVVTLENLAARQMADKIEVVIYNGDGTQASELWTDSIRDYAMRSIEKQDAETKTMMVDMLNYGAAAQTYFKYNTADLANNQLSEEQQAYATEAVACEDKRIKGDNYFGSTLVLKNRIMLTMYFRNITTEMYAVVSFTDHKGNVHENRIEGIDFARYNDTTYGVTVDNLVVADGDQMVTVVVYDKNGDAVASASDTVNSYASRMISSDVLFEQVAKFTTSAYAHFH